MGKKLIVHLDDCGVILCIKKMFWIEKRKNEHTTWQSHKSLQPLNALLPINSNVDGMCFLAGNSVKVSGAQDYLFTAGKKIEIDQVNVKDAFVAVGYCL